MNSALRRRLLILCLSIAVATASVFSQETAKKAPPKKVPVKVASSSAGTSAEIALPTIKYEKYTLPNGLVVILSEDHRLPLVSTNMVSRWPRQRSARAHRFRPLVRAHDVR